MEAIIRASAFFGILLIMIVWEYLRPKRTLSQPRRQRWPINMGLGIFNMALMRVSVGAIAYQSALIAENNGWGLLNQFTLTHWSDLVITFLLMDFAIYLQHIISHKWRWLWRLHRVHHTDIDFDTTTAIRFHPLEIIISMAYKVGLIFLIGANPMAIIAFEIILNGSAMFNHGNVAIPYSWDQKLRWFIITPDMHRIHHSTIKTETDSNYGFSISCWDRLCRTYTDKAQMTQTEMNLGQADFRDTKQLGWLNLLQQPFLRKR